MQIKQTEVSGRWPVPSNWKWYTLSDVIDPQEPETGEARALNSLVDDTGTCMIIFSHDLQDTKEIHVNNRIKWQDANTLKQFTGRKLLVVAAYETRGTVGILSKNQTAIINDAVHIITPNEEYILLDFLFYYFLLQQTRIYLQNELTPNSTYISPGILATAKVVVPPLQEQQHIVERIEALTHNIEKSLRLLRVQQENIITVLEQTLFEVFSPEHFKTWPETIPMSTLVDITAMPQKVERKAYENYPYIHPKALEPFTGRLLELKNLRESNIPENRKLYILENAHGTLLYAPASGSDRLHRISMLQLNKAVCHADLFPLVVLPQNPERVLPDFIYWSLFASTLITANTPMRLVNAGITRRRLLASSLPFPSTMHEQRAIINHLNTIQDIVRKIREKQDEELQRVNQVKQNILEKAFRGLL